MSNALPSREEMQRAIELDRACSSVWLAGLPERRCPECGGRGTVCDPAEIGRAMRNLREEAGLTMREVARRMGYSAMYLCDLEHGRRSWPPDKIEAYVKALRPANAEMGREGGETKL